MIGSGATPWLHYTTRRKEAEQLLRRELELLGEGGLFLIRAKKEDQGQYVLDSAWWDDTSHGVILNHHLITRSPNGNFEMDEQAFERWISLDDLVEYLTKPRNKFFQKSLSRYLPAPSQDNVTNSQRRNDVQSAA